MADIQATLPKPPATQRTCTLRADTILPQSQPFQFGQPREDFAQLSHAKVEQAVAPELQLAQAWQPLKTFTQNTRIFPSQCTAYKGQLFSAPMDWRSITGRKRDSLGVVRLYGRSVTVIVTMTP